MTTVEKFAYGLVCILLLVSFVAVTGAPIGVKSNATDSNRTKALVCVGFCPQVTVKPRSCFSADNWVSLFNGHQQNIGKLTIGDNVVSFDGANIVGSEMILMLDRNTYTTATFYTLQTESNHTISLTREHLIAIVSSDGIVRYIPAGHVKVRRDALYVLSNNQHLVRSLITRMTIETKVGYFAPLTTTGTLLVNNVLVSCFSHIHNHALGQLSMAPVRWYRALTHHFSFMAHFVDTTNVSNQDGLHWISQGLLNFAERFYPSVLNFS